MKTLFAFFKKELFEQMRTGKLLILAIIFLALGIMNPAIAKLTPWMLDLMSEALAESGMNIETVEVDALTSWTQFYKNIPIGLIVFLVIEGGILTREISSGTLILALTKGLDRYKVLVSKAFVLILSWSVNYAICFVVSYLGTALFWDNSIGNELIFAGLCWWMAGVLASMLIILFSVITKSYPLTLLMTGGVCLISYIIGLIPKITKYTPTALFDGTSLVYGAKDVADYIPAFIITVGLSVVCFTVSIPIFNKKQL